MESFNEKINVDSENPISTPEAIEFVPDFFLKQEVLKMFDIELEEKDLNKDGSVRSPELKDKLYEALASELQKGSSYALEFILGEELLSQADLKERNIRQLKETALTILNKLRGQQRAHDRNIFVSAGILTQEETTQSSDALYSVQK